MGGCGQKWAWDSNFNELMNLSSFLHANTYLRKLKATLKLLGGHGQIWVFPFRSRDSIICCISRMDEWIELVLCILIHACSCMVSRKLKVTLDMYMVKYGKGLLGLGSLKSAYLNSKINRWIVLIFFMMKVME